MRPTLKTLLAASVAFAPLAASARTPAETEVTLSHMEQPPHRVASIQERIDAFNTANPAVGVRQEPQNRGKTHAKAMAAVAAGAAGPYMLFAIPDVPPILKETGARAPVEDFAAELVAKQDLADVAVETCSHDGGVRAVPLCDMTMHL